MTQELKPNSIHFQTGEPTKCVMRIEADRIWVDPDIEVTEAASLVLQALEANIKRLVLAEREACAKVCEDYTDNDRGAYSDDEGHGYECAAAIRARGEK